MAKTIKQLQAELDKATEQARKTFDVLNPPFGNDAPMLEKEYKKAVANKDQKKIAELKPAYDKALAAYTQAQNKKNAINKELKALQKEEKTVKEESTKDKVAQSSYDTRNA
jgi:allophanate hydrolase subunit 1